jgi:serpin B
MKRPPPLVLSALTVLILGLGCPTAAPPPGGGEGSGERAEARTAQNDDAKAALTAVLNAPEVLQRADAVPTADVAQVVAGNNDFNGAFLGTLPRGENVVFSAHSISTAVNLTSAGAAGDTLSEMRAALRVRLPDERQHPGIFALDHRMMSDGNAVDVPVTLRTANRVWLDRSLDGGIPDGFQTVVREFYGAGFEVVDFGRAPEPSRLKINTWVADQTAQRIPNLLPDGVISTDTLLVLTNAVYFLADWLHAFSPDATRDEPFHAVGGKDVVVPLMHQNEVFGYCQGDGYQAAELPYEGGKFSMLVVLPQDGSFDAVETLVIHGLLGEVSEQMHRTEIDLTLPRFTLRWSGSLKSSLMALGMTVPFSTDADFSRLAGPGAGLAISDVLHEAFVTVDESGTEAAAATALVLEVTSVAIPIMMRVDRPFFFAIRHVESGALLFTGRVMNPAAG